MSSCGKRLPNNISLGNLGGGNKESDLSTKPYLVKEPISFEIPDSVGGKKLFGSVTMMLEITKSGNIEFYPRLIRLSTNQLYPDEHFIISSSEWKDSLIRDTIPDLELYYRHKSWIDKYIMTCKFTIDTSYWQFKYQDTLYYQFTICPNKGVHQEISYGNISFKSKELYVSESLCRNRMRTEFVIILRVNKYGKILRYDVTDERVYHRPNVTDYFDAYRSQIQLQKEHNKYRNIIDGIIRKTVVSVDSTDKYFNNENIFPYWIYIVINSKTRKAYAKNIGDN